MQMKEALIAIKDQQDFSVILLDLDWFKEINDKYGHEVGDRVLAEVAQTLLQSLAEETIISRYGGEEFLIVLPDTKHDSAMLIAEQIRLSIANQVITVEDDVTFNVTTSLGLYTLTHEERNCIKQTQEILAQQEAPHTAIEKKKLSHVRSSSHATKSITQPLSISLLMTFASVSFVQQTKRCMKPKAVVAIKWSVPMRCVTQKKEWQLLFMVRNLNPL
ncbi:hypothetical protein Psyaliredsea_26850 [Psychrobacter alimentarius]